MTRMPFSPSICAKLAQKLAIAALVAAYGASVGFGISEFTDELPIIAEPSFIWGIAALHRWNIALMLVSIVRSHSSSETSSSESWLITGGGVAHQNVHAAELIDRALDDVPAVLRICNVALHRYGTSTGLLDVAGGVPLASESSLR